MQALRIMRLMEAFDSISLQGHSLVVIEHNFDVVKCADNLIYWTPEGGENSGIIILSGDASRFVLNY